MKKLEFSKKICLFSSILFLSILVISLIFSIFNLNIDLFMYLIPSAATICSICFGFYFNKAKSENLSKQRIRTTLLKLVLEEKLDSDTYEELLEELDNIDTTIQNKLQSMYENAIDEEVDTSDIVIN